MDIDKLVEKLDDAMTASIKTSAPPEKVVVSRFAPTHGQSMRPPATIRVEKSNPTWWEDWMYEDAQ